jgi:hypothetical protein
MIVLAQIQLYAPQDVINRPSWRVWEISREHAYANESRTAVSHALVCPACGQIWARHIIKHDTFCWPKAQFCERCDEVYPDSWHPVPGSLFINEGFDTIDDSLLAALPLDLLKREFTLTEKAIANGNIDSHADWPRRALAATRNQRPS